MKLFQQLSLHARVERRTRNDTVEADRDFEEIERREFDDDAPYHDVHALP